MIYARGLVTHSLVPAAHLVTVRPTRMMRSGTGGRRGGGVTIITGAVTDIQWKALTELPQPNVPERHGRDALYAANVAQRPLLEPIEVAERFLRTRP